MICPRILFLFPYLWPADPHLNISQAHSLVKVKTLSNAAFSLRPALATKFKILPPLSFAVPCSPLLPYFTPFHVDQFRICKFLIFCIPLEYIFPEGGVVLFPLLCLKYQEQRLDVVMAEVVVDCPLSRLRARRNLPSVHLPLEVTDLKVS